MESHIMTEIQMMKTVEKVPLKIKKLKNFLGELPKYQSVGASGFDICAQVREPIVIQPGDRVLVPTGLSFEIPLGYEIQCRPRSGLAAKLGVSVLNTPGTIDADYRGEVQVILVNLGKESVKIVDQERIAQMVLAPVVQAHFIEVVELSETARGAGGFGSTGR